uniref:Glucuronosyltransferase n=1 Tax=Parascaris equorum TaxID=6256 RepID=A0A914RV82_PAREQ
MIPSIGCVFLAPIGNCTTSLEKFGDLPAIIGSHSAADTVFASFPYVAPTLQPMDSRRPYYSSKSGFHPNFEAAKALPLISAKRKLFRYISDCPPSFASHFEIIDGIEILAERIAEFKIQTPEACMHACATNTVLFQWRSIAA